MTEQSLAERLQTASTDLTSLSRVSHRLALVDEATKLQQVLDKLLPRLLHRIGDNHQAQQNATEASLRDSLSKIHAKLVEMLSHVMKRVREDQSVQLNCKEIVQLLLVVNDDTGTGTESVSCDIPKPKEKVDPFTLNLTLAFLTLGLPRCTKDQLQELLPGLLVLVGYHSGKVETLVSVSLKSQWHQLTHLLLKAMESIMVVEEGQMKKTPSSAYKKQKQQSSTTDTETTTTKDEDGLELTRRVLQQDTRAAGACYNLLLDVLLYQTVAGNVPPGGLSQAAHERLKGGHSASARDWAAEMAVRSRLCQCKNRILDWMAPSRKWGLFLDHNNKDTNTNLGMARTVALLVAASGDPTLEVSQRASTYLKQHFDNYRNHPERAFGDCMALVADLLRLCVGNTATTRGASEIPNLGLPAPESSPEHAQLALQFQRRAVSEMTFGALATFCSKTMDDTPQLITVETVERIGTLSILTSSKTLGNLRTASGLTLLRGKPFIAAAQLLNSVVVRVSNLEGSSGYTVMTDLLSKSLAAACSVLSLVSTPRSTTSATTTGTTSEGNVAVRDAMYGVVCALSRSSLAQEGTWLFGAGQASSSNTNMETASLLFGCAANEEETLRPRAVAALDALLAAYCRAYTQPATTPKVETTAVDNPWSQVATPVAPTDDSVPQQQRELAIALLPLIWTASQHYASKQARVAAARWSSDLLKELDLPNACHLLCFLAGDPDVTASSIAKQGLGLDTEGAVLPDFRELTTLIFYENSNASRGWRPRYSDFSPQGKAAAIRFSLQCLLNDLYGGEDEAVQSYVAAITKTLGEVAHFGREYFELSDECATCLSTCLSTSSYARSLLATKKTSLGLSDLEDLALSASSSQARRHLAESCGYLYEDLSLWESQDWIGAIQRPMSICAAEIVNSVSIRLHGAAFLGATCVRAFRLYPSNSVDTCWDLACKILQALGDGTLNSDEIISNSFADSLAIALSYSADDAPILDERLYTGTTAALVKLATSLRKYGNGDHADATRTTKLAHAAGICLASSTSGAGSTDSNLGAARLDMVDALFSLLGSTAFRKDEEIALVTGEALACYADAYSPKDVVWSSQSSNWPDDLNEDFAKELPPHQQVLYTLLRRMAITSNPHKRTACAPALLAVVAHSASRVNRKSSYAHRSLVRELCEHLGEVQNAFVALLADPKSKHLSRESCCLGLAACRSLADISGVDEKSTNSSDDLNEKLLRAFGQTTNYGGSAMMETREQAAERRRAQGVNREGNTDTVMEPLGTEAEVGGASGLGEAALGAYREMAAAAVSLGRPDVLYALLMLSVSHPVWSTSASRDDYTASALLGENSIIGGRTSAVEMREALRPHLGKLLPRMLRACHDPNKQTREQMSNLWNGLTGGGAEARLAITEHLLPTIDVLIEEASSKLWRARVGACGALSQIIVARSWTELGGGPPVLDDDEVLANTTTSSTIAGARLLRLWRVAIRSLDDVRGAVRDSGETLARGVRSLTIRLCDPLAADDSTGSTLASEDRARHERDASSASATSLRWLIQRGLNLPNAEATGLCVSCLVGIVDVVKPAILQPLIPELLRSLLFAMSGLEPAALSYLQVRAAGEESGSGGNYERLERIRLQLAQSGPLATAVTKCLAMLPRCDLEVQKSVIPQLDAALRLSAGFASRAATADAVSTLCSSCPNAFKFTGSSSTNPSVRLLRALYFASEREHGQAARDKMSHALGNLAGLCPGSSVRSLALRACDRYNSSNGNNDDPAARRAAAIALRSIAVRATNQFSDGGNSDVWCRRVLPVAFLGMKDSDTKVASLWKEVWEEGGSAANLAGAGDDFGSLLEEKLLPFLVKECIKALDDVSWSRRVTGAVALGELADLRVLCPAPRSVNASKANMSFLDAERARRRAKASSSALIALVTILAGSRLWSGKAEVVKATVKVASNWVAATADSEIDEYALFGVDASDGPCEWKPITVSPGQFEDDLFVGDSWFVEEEKVEMEEDTVELNGSSKAMEVDEGSDEVKIDFEEGDKLLDGENQVSSTDDDAMIEEKCSIVTFSGLCRALLNQAFPLSARSMMSVSEDEVLPYRAAALQAFAELVTSLGSFSTSNSQKQQIFLLISPNLIRVFDTERRFQLEKQTTEESPLVVARSIDCLSAAFWDGIGQEESSQEVPTSNVLDLMSVLQTCGGSGQPAWTVREAAALGCANLVSECHTDALRNHTTISTMVDCVAQALKDRKFWRVRLSGLKVLRAMIKRAGNATENVAFDQSSQARDKQLVLEAMLPQKEKMLKLARQALSDSEAKVTALSSDIISAMAWWP